MDEVEILPPPLRIQMDEVGTRQSMIIGEDQGACVPFTALGSTGESGSAFATDGRVATAELVACARLFVERHRLTGTDPHSLALPAEETPSLKEELLKLRDEVGGSTR